MAVFGCEMACFGRLTAYYGKEINALTGKRSLVFDERKAHSPVPIRVPCGTCIGCLMARRRQWAVRCMHEKRMHSASAFVTLTYADLPADGSLRKEDLQLFMKRLRARRPTGLRFFACGEYGETTLRPHYHLLLFNTDFPDQRFYKSSPAGEPLYVSAELSDLWPAGSNAVGALTFGSAAYVAGYVTKKITSPLLVGAVPPFVVMSRRPGLGATWFERFHPEAYKHDSAIMKGREVGLPRFYDDRFDLVDSKRLARIKRLRRARAREHPEDNTLRRLRVREEFEQRKSEMFAREF
ncbi:replication initiator protein [Blackfly microvirus SF02]|uniref:Replication initiator protein n=1 Tax=Blackfly microvirus SF02 TaxID=2576452 RepID=A0A4P8PL59_9VIRU|nr:replication initiator protein [Blackfly microvirus SF02]